MPDKKPLKITIVEDEMSISLYEQLILEKNGFIVASIAESSEAAIRSVRDNVPDLILMDIQLRGPVDGIDTAALIQKEHDIPVIFLSAIVDVENISRIRDIQSHGFLCKPINEYELLMTIEMAVERHRLYRYIKQNEHKYRFIFENIQEVYFEMSRDGKIIEVSPSVKGVFGGERQEIIGHNISEYLINKENRGLIFSILKSKQSGKLYDIEFSGKDQKTVICDMAMSVVWDINGEPLKIVGSISDISSRKKNEDLLRNAHHEIEAILLSMSTVLIGVSLRDKITHWNRQAELLFNIPASQVIGSQVTQMKMNWEWDRIYEGISMAISSDCAVDMQEVRYSPRMESERNRYLNIKITPIKDYHDSLRGFLLTGDDITERRALRIRSNQSQKLESIGQLASGVAHEINTPTQYINDNTLFLKKAFECILSNTTVQLGILESQKKDLKFYIDEVPLAIDQTLEGISKISKIVSSMKQFSHPGTQEKIEYDICRIVDDAVTLTRNAWKYVSDVEIMNCGTPAMVMCHPNQISQVLVNMIVNSAQAIEEKFGKQTEKKGKIEIEIVNDVNAVTLRVNDNGSGIPDEVKEKIFDPFFTTKEVGKGTGQGLAIAYSVISAMHGGIVQVESTPGQGTTFIIKLPKK